MAESPLTVLIVDDDADVLDATCAMIEYLGYAALGARTGLEALAFLQRDASVRVLLTDITMPGMNGWQLAHRAKEIRPDLRVIYTTGYAHARVPEASGPGYGPLLPKPWRASALAEILRTVVKMKPLT
jgi:CheY-like chemotaxis protein